MTPTKHISGPVLHSPRPKMKMRLSSSVLQCANQYVKSITLQASGKSQQMKFCTHTHTHTASGPGWVHVSPAGDTWRGGTDSSLTDMQERELKRMSTQTLYSHQCLDYNFNSWSKGTTVDTNWQNMFLTQHLIFFIRDNPPPALLSQTFRLMAGGLDSIAVFM